MIQPLLVVMLALSAGCADKSAPTFPDGAQIEAEATADRVVLSWPLAEDDRAVSAYVVMRDGQEVGTTASAAHTLEGVAELTTMKVEVVALDEAGNRSDALATEVRSADVTPPYFAEWARSDLRVRRRIDPEKLRVDLVWTHAADNDGVARYLVLRGEEEIASVQSGDPSEPMRLEFDAPASAGDFTIVALDRAGSRSAPLEVDGAKPIGRWLRLESGPPATERDRRTEMALSMGTLIPVSSAIDPFAQRDSENHGGGLIGAPVKGDFGFGRSDKDRPSGYGVGRPAK